MDAFLQEAALAVAAVDKRRRGQYGSNADSMNGNNVSRKFYSVKLLPGRPVLYPGVAYSFFSKFRKNIVQYVNVSALSLNNYHKSYVLYMYISKCCTLF